MEDRYVIIRDNEKVISRFAEYGPAVAKLAEYGKFLEDIGYDVYVLSNREIEIHGYGHRHVYQIKF